MIISITKKPSHFFQWMAQVKFKVNINFYFNDSKVTVSTCLELLPLLEIIPNNVCEKHISCTFMFTHTMLFLGGKHIMK